MRSARRLAATPGPGRFFGQDVTIVQRRTSCAMAGAGRLLPAAAAATPATPAFAEDARNLRRFMASYPLRFLAAARRSG